MFCACCESGQEVEEFKEVTTLPILVPQSETPNVGPTKAPSFGSFEVMISMKGHGSFGVQLDVTDKSAGPMITQIQSGAVQSFNAQNPTQALEVWDTIAELEDAKGMAEVFAKMSGPLPDTVTWGSDLFKDFFWYFHPGSLGTWNPIWQACFSDGLKLPT